MPVDQLLCEGGNNSPDVVVLRNLLIGRCGVLALGAKYGMGSRIIARREAVGRDDVYGILDGDFVNVWKQPLDQPVDWKGSDGTLFGWRWERKEIENYLIDPVVVDLALNRPNHAVPIHDYQSALGAAR